MPVWQELLVRSDIEALNEVGALALPTRAARVVAGCEWIALDDAGLDLEGLSVDEHAVVDESARGYKVLAGLSRALGAPVCMCRGDLETQWMQVSTFEQGSMVRMLEARPHRAWRIAGDKRAPWERRFARAAITTEHEEGVDAYEAADRRVITLKVLQHGATLPAMARADLETHADFGALIGGGGEAKTLSPRHNAANMTSALVGGPVPATGDRQRSTPPDIGSGASGTPAGDGGAIKADAAGPTGGTPDSGAAGPMLRFEQDGRGSMPLGVLGVGVGVYLAYAGFGPAMAPKVLPQEIILAAALPLIAVGIVSLRRALEPAPRGAARLTAAGVVLERPDSARTIPYSALTAGPPLEFDDYQRAGHSRDEFEGFERAMRARARATTGAARAGRVLEQVELAAVDALAKAARSRGDGNGDLAMPFAVAAPARDPSAGFEVVETPEQVFNRETVPDEVLYLAGYGLGRSKDDTGVVLHDWPPPEVSTVDLGLQTSDPAYQFARRGAAGGGELAALADAPSLSALVESIAESAAGAWMPDLESLVAPIVAAAPEVRAMAPTTDPVGVLVALPILVRFRVAYSGGPAAAALATRAFAAVEQLMGEFEHLEDALVGTLWKSYVDSRPTASADDCLFEYLGPRSKRGIERAGAGDGS